MIKVSLRECNRTVRAMLFDMDNTLFDLVSAKLKACSEVAEYVGINDGIELYNYFVRDDFGYEDLNNIADYLRDKEIYNEDNYASCCEIYEDIKIENIEPYEGVKETLDSLIERGLKLAVVTNADHRNLELRLNKTGLNDYFDVTISSDTTQRVKPDRAPILSALNKLRVKPVESMKIGDSLLRDITPAKELGMITVHAEYGDKNMKEDGLPKPDFVIKEFKDLMNLLD